MTNTSTPTCQWCHERIITGAVVPGYPLHLECSVAFLFDAMGIAPEDIKALPAAAADPVLVGLPSWADRDSAKTAALAGALGVEAQAAAEAQIAEVQAAADAQLAAAEESGIPVATQPHTLAELVALAPGWMRETDVIASALQGGLGQDALAIARQLQGES